jgi:hypothetical protein
MSNAIIATVIQSACDSYHLLQTPDLFILPNMPPLRNISKKIPNRLAVQANLLRNEPKKYW